MAVVYGRRGANRSAGEVYGLGRVGLGAAVGDACMTSAGQPGTVQEWYDPDMQQVVGMICTTDPPGTRIYRHVTSPATGYSSPSPSPAAPIVPVTSSTPAAPAAPAPPALPAALPPGPVVTLAPPPGVGPGPVNVDPSVTGGGLAMPGAPSSVESGSGMTAGQAIGALAALAALAYLMRER